MHIETQEKLFNSN